jgi:hypothetical protein
MYVAQQLLVVLVTLVLMLMMKRDELQIHEELELVYKVSLVVVPFLEL